MADVGRDRRAHPGVSAAAWHVAGTTRHLVGRSESWLSQVERDTRPVENLAVLALLAEVLDVELDRPAGQPLRLAPPAGTPVADEVAAIRDALSGYAELAALLAPMGTDR